MRKVKPIAKQFHQWNMSVKSTMLGSRMAVCRIAGEIEYCADCQPDSGVAVHLPATRAQAVADGWVQPALLQ